MYEVLAFDILSCSLVGFCSETFRKIDLLWGMFMGDFFIRVIGYNNNSKGECMAGKSNYPFEWEHEKYENVFITGKQKNKLPPLEILNWLFRYDSESGKLYKVRDSSGKACEPEREITTVANRYLQVGITDGNGLQKMFQVHQIIYYIVSGIEPLQIVDHRDGDKLNNRFDNLRLTTGSGNQRNKRMLSNNRSGTTGVSWHKRESKWRARAYDNTGKQKHLGYFDDITEATAVVHAHYSNPELGYSDRHGI